VIALGHHLSGLMSNDDTLAQEMLRAGVDAEDRAWHLPIGEDYDEQLKSNFADFANVGGPRGRRDHRGVLPRALHPRPQVGAPRHRRHRMENRPGQGRDRSPVPLLAQFLMSRAGVA
jgi:leucyl aminopeptidase